jgi:hypothetical protein
VSRDARNSLFAVAVVFTIGLLIWADSRFAWPAGIAMALVAATIAFARSWVERNASSKSKIDG